MIFYELAEGDVLRPAPLPEQIGLAERVIERYVGRSATGDLGEDERRLYAAALLRVANYLSEPTYYIYARSDDGGT